MSFRTTFAATVLTAMFTSTASADVCKVDVADAFELEEAGIVALYDCLKEKMATGYGAAGDEVATNYRSWAVTSTRPAVAGPHGNRFLQTFANDIAAEQYLKFEEDGFTMPAGSVLANESFSISKKQEGRVGPLFIMTKLEPGGAPDAADWLYAGIQPNGKVMKVKQSFCHDCHAGYEEQDYLAYPLEEVRLSN